MTVLSVTSARHSQLHLEDALADSLSGSQKIKNLFPNRPSMSSAHTLYTPQTDLLLLLELYFVLAVYLSRP